MDYTQIRHDSGMQQQPLVWPEVITMLRRRMAGAPLVQSDARIRYTAVNLADLVIDCYQHGEPPAERYSLLISNLTDRTLMYVQVLYSGEVVISKRAENIDDFNTIWRDLKENPERWHGLAKQESVALINGLIPLLMGSLV
ncbi:MAG: hypothetical protein VKJ06_07385 [Vampirovibrionales bacterium]|nr:hypothetical protein [Vampirovibrionales bacterium]